ncbi:hypothetical protein CBL23_15315 [Shigella sonnei]|nr:hypothetical protein CBL23_15315 [Shigella sonnei]
MLLVIVRDSKARYSFQSSFSSLNICHQRILIIVITQAFTFGEFYHHSTPLVLIILWTFYDCSGLLIKISQNQFTRKSGKTLRPS